MKKLSIRKLFVFLLLMPFLLGGALGAQEAGAQNQDILAGTWTGDLDLGQRSLPVVFHITKNDDGSYKATFDSPDQNAFDIPVTSVALQGMNVTIVFDLLKAGFQGTFQKETGTIRGAWHQQGATLPLELKRGEGIVRKSRPQEPHQPYPYNAEQVKFTDTADGVTLAGTLTYPKGGKKFPAVVLISGSGPQNRDEELYNHKPFLVWADYLTRHGIAVLRYDDRGFADSTGNFAAADTPAFARDAEAAVQFLKSRKEIDQGKIGLVGHSEGGIIASLVAEKDRDIAFIVLLAGTGVPGDQIILTQSSAMMKAAGLPEDRIEKTNALNKSIYGAIRNIKDKKQLREKLKELISSTGADDRKIQSAIDNLLSPWFTFFLTFDPAVALEKVACPVLAVDGSKDLQVDASVNLPAIEAAVIKGGNKNVTTKTFEGLNHLFQPAKTGLPAEYADIDTTVAEKVLKYVTDWILRTAG